MKKRFLSCLAALALCLTLLPAATLAAEHTHPVCGDVNCKDSSHALSSEEKWVGARDVTGLKAGGHYYLMRDVTVSETWHPEDNVVLCLNGHSITATARGINVIQVDKGRTFTLTDCAGGGKITHDELAKGRGVKVLGTFNLYGGNITDNLTDGNYNDGFTFGGGVCVMTNSVFNMYGGKITHNVGYSGGGGVYVAPTYADTSRAVFNMSGGEISHNSSSYGNSGGMYVYGGEFIMSGGSITDNTGYGVYLCDYKSNFGQTYSGAFTVSDKVNIAGNTKSNVFLSTGKTITVGGPLDAASKIGISTEDEASAVITTGMAAENYESIFFSDVTDKGFTFTEDENGAIRFHGHDHNWQFTATAEKINAKCTASNCSVTANDGNNGGFVRLNVRDTTYGYNDKNAWVNVSEKPAWRGPEASTIEISYRNSVTGENLGTTAPTLPGSYTASITVEGQTVTRDFKINKATPQASDFIFAAPSNDDLTYDDNAKTATVTAKSGVTGMGAVTVKYFKNGVEVEPKNAGDYTVKVSVAEGDNYNAATDLTANDWKFTITPGTQTITVPKDKTIVKNGKPVNISEWATVSGVGNGDGLWALSYELDGQAPEGVSLTGKQLTVQPTCTAAQFAIKVTAMETNNYNAAEETFIVTVINKRPASIEVYMTGWTYGERAKSPGYMQATNAGEATVTYAKADGTVLNEQPTDAGEYTVKVQYETDTEIYTGTANFTISPKNLQQEMLAQITGDRYYNGEEQTPDVTVTDGEKTLKKDVDYTVSYSNNTNAGTATVTVTGKGNYEGIISTTFVINPATLDIIGEDKMTATASYGTKVKDIPVSSAMVCFDNKDGVAEVPGTWKFDGEGMDDIPEVGNTKAYKAIFTPSSGSENIRECFTYITPSISRAAGSVTDPVAKANLVYNGEKQALLETPLTSSTGTVQYSLDGTNYTETPPAGKEAGTYTVFYKVVGDKNHQDVAAQSIQVEIKKLAITVTAEDKTSRVGLALAELTYTYTPELAVGDAFTGTLATSAHPDTAGSYSITQGNLALNENYTIDFRDGTYTVEDKQAQSDFRFESIPSAVSKTYGDADFSAAAVGAAPGSTVTYESSDETVATVDDTGKVTIKGAGTADITARATATEDYDEAAVTCTLTVKKKPIAIPAADATVFTYNGTEQTYTLAEDGAYTITGNKQTNANETGYAVTVALKDTANTQWADETIADKSYTFVIGKAVITVKAKDQTAYVGDKAPALGEDSYTVSGLVGDEKLTTQPTVKYVGADGSEITPDMTKTGEVNILAGGAVASGNYTIRYEEGKLTVSTRPSSGGGSSRPSNHPVQTEVSKDPDGTVSLSKTSAAKGDKVTITVKPERHYKVDEVIVRDSKGKQLALKDNGDGTFTFEMPADKVTVEPTFSWVNPFADVADNAYYVDAVEWMLKREVTQGTTESTFSPNLNCTRAQIVTFLWRAAGSPAPKDTVSFADVSADSYYAKAVAWAVENGVTGGTGDGLFSPDATCTRAQSAAFLYRAAGSPAVNGSAEFSDVAANAYYAQAVAWAKEHGITDGIGGGLFGSDNDCTRAQIATFLWRLYAEK